MAMNLSVSILKISQKTLKGGVSKWSILCVTRENGTTTMVVNDCGQRVRCCRVKSGGRVIWVTS